MGFYENTPTSNFGESDLRLPDGVDVIEAESNPAHGHYIGDWQPVRNCVFCVTNRGATTRIIFIVVDDALPPAMR